MGPRRRPIMPGRPTLPFLLLVTLAVSCSAGPDEQVADELLGPAANDHHDDDDQGGMAHIRHVLLISIDGLHQVDVTRFIADHPDSTMARLAQTGVEFENAWVNRLDGTATNPTDSFPGLLALTTGGSSKTHGGWYDVSYARDLYPDATRTTPGTEVAYDEGIDVNNGGLWGNTAMGTNPTHDPKVVRTRIDPTKLPYRKTATGCS